MARSKKMLTKGQIGAGFFNDHIEAAKKSLHAHAHRLAKKHHAHIKTHMRKTTHRLFKAKDRKAELHKVGREMIAKGITQANIIHEKGRAAAKVHVERLKQKAIKRVKSKVCGDVGSGFFSSVGSFFGKLFGGVKAAAHTAIRTGTAVVKKHVQAAPAMLKAHLVANKDKYMEAAKTAAADVAQNGRAGLNRTMEKVKKHMVSKARSVAGCKGSGGKSGGGGKTGGGARVAGGGKTGGGARVAGGIKVAGGMMKVVY